jgi:F-type H+-transporting ATPase subunit delta
MGAINTNLIAKNYSRALFAAAKQSGVQEKVSSEISFVSDAFSAVNEAKSFFSNPLIPLERKREVATKLISEVSIPELKETLSLMVQNNRFQFLPELRTEFAILVDEEKGLLRGTVVSSAPLADDVRKRISDKMTAHFKKQVLFDFVISPQVLGGTRVEVGGLTFDDSVEGHLHRMADDLNRSRV